MANEILAQNKKTNNLLLLQKDYLVKSISSIDEILELVNTLDSTNDPDLIKVYLKRLDELEEETDINFNIACKIEESLK